MSRRPARTAKGPRGLTPVVGAAMASVAAGSLIMFSLLAEKVVEPRSSGVAVQPRVPREVDAERSLTVPPPPPEHVGGTPPTSPATSFVLRPPEEAPQPPSPAIHESDRREPLRFVVADLSVDVPQHGRIQASGPRNRVPLSRPTDDGCPGRPQKPGSPGSHPLGGPPACGNPHGEPPGQEAKGGHEKGRGGGASDSARGNPHATPPGHSDKGGAAAGHSHDGHPQPSSDGPNEGGSPAPPAQPGPPSGGSHPHGAPPGQTKESSGESASSGSASSGHPHGAPPGQEKKKS
jgi:hypothetical protein